MAIIMEKRNLRGLIIDATVSERLSKGGGVTSNPVSIGSDVHDHMFSNTTEIVIRAIIGLEAPKNYFQNLPNSEILSDSPVITDNNLGFFDMNNPTEAVAYIRRYYPEISNEEAFLNIKNNSQNSEQLAVEFISNNTGMTVQDTRSDVIRRNNSYDTNISDIGIKNFGSSESSFDFDANGTSTRTRTQAAWCRLEELMDNREVCRLVTNLKVYPEVVITNIDTNVNSDNCEKLDVNITLKEIKRVSSVEARIRSINTNSGTANRGNQDVKCLKLSDVFNNSSSSNITGRKVTTEIANNNTATVNFSRDVYTEGICGAIGERFVTNLRANVINSYVEEDVEQGRSSIYNGIFVIRTNSFGEPETIIPTSSGIENTCRALLDAQKDGEFGSSCVIPEACKDTRYVRPDETVVEEAKTSTTAQSLDTIREQASQRISQLVASSEVISQDPSSQFSVDRANATTLREVRGFLRTELPSSFRDTQINRLNCYYCTVLNTLSGDSSTIAGQTLQRIFNNGNCEGPFKVRTATFF